MIGKHVFEGRWRAAAYVLMLAFSCFGCAAVPERPLGDVGDLDALRQEAVSLVNQARREGGLADLRMTGPLNAAAQAHAEDMARRSYYSHRSPERRDVANRYLARGGGPWRMIAENIANCGACLPPAEQVRTFHRGWMQSPGHRRNILTGQFDGFGFGVAVVDDGTVYAVQTFVEERD